VHKGDDDVVALDQKMELCAPHLDARNRRIDLVVLRVLRAGHEPEHAATGLDGNPPSAAIRIVDEPIERHIRLGTDAEIGLVEKHKLRLAVVAGAYALILEHGASGRDRLRPAADDSLDLILHAHRRTDGRLRKRRRRVHCDGDGNCQNQQATPVHASVPPALACVAALQMPHRRREI
jgi:hypothetical protein